MRSLGGATKGTLESVGICDVEFSIHDDLTSQL